MWAMSAPLPSYFYPRSPCGERLLNALYAQLFEDFYPRSPCGERQLTPILMSAQGHFYPRSVPSANGGAASISIHALLAESDPPE